jgi:hypothetical protein
MPPHDRKDMLYRLVFANIGGLLALIGVIFSSGLFVGRMDEQGRKLDRIEARQEVASDKLQTVVTDVALIKAQLIAQGSRIDKIERRGEK